MQLRRALTVLAFVGLAACGDEGTQTEPTASGVTTESAESSASSDASSGTSDDGSTSGGGSSSTSGSTTAAPTSSTTASASTGEAGSTGEARGDQWADTQITYSGDGVMETVVLDDCFFCDATLSSGIALLRYQQADGWTVWSIYLPDTLGPGTHTLTPDGTGSYVVINENNPDLPAAAHGFYPFASNVGTVTLTEADLTPGGTVSGTIDTALSLGGITANFEAEFTAVLTAL